MKVAEWLSVWYNTYVVGERFAPSTVAMYGRSVRAVSGALGGVELSQLTPIDCYIYIKARAAVHPRAAQLDRVMLTRAMHVAVKCGLRGPLVLDDDTCPAPVHRAREAVVLTAEQLRTYQAAAMAVEPDLCALLLMCACGLRRGEALGMRWECIDLKAGCMHVRVQRQRVGGVYAVRPPKSAAGVRLVALSPALAAALAARRRELAGWVVDATPERLQQAHRHVVRVAGLPPVTLHGLRHTIATLAAGAGMPIKQLQVCLGHSSYKITADLYADHIEDSTSAMRAVYTALEVAR